MIQRNTLKTQSALAKMLLGMALVITCAVLVYGIYKSNLSQEEPIIEIEEIDDTINGRHIIVL